jgi:hypothetical protein
MVFGVIFPKERIEIITVYTAYAAAIRKALHIIMPSPRPGK